MSQNYFKLANFTGDSFEFGFKILRIPLFCTKLAVNFFLQT